MIASPALVGIVGALTVLAFVLALWLPAFAQARLMRRRIAGIAVDVGLAADRGGQRVTGATFALPAWRGSGRLGWLSQAIALADAGVTPGEIVGVAALLAAASGAGAYLFGRDVVVALSAATLGAVAPFLWLRFERGRRRGRLAAQLPDTVQLLASLVRGGNTFLQALEHVSQESPEPTRSALAIVVREIGLGASQESALDRFAERFPSDDLTLLVAAVNVHQQIGGSLSGVLEQIAETLRERVRLQGEIRTLTAAQRLSAYVLAALPVIVAVLRAYTDPAGFQLFFTVDYLRVALVLAAAMVVAGSIVMRRIASIDV